MIRIILCAVYLVAACDTDPTTTSAQLLICPDGTISTSDGCVQDPGVPTPSSTTLIVPIPPTFTGTTASDLAARVSGNLLDPAGIALYATLAVPVGTAIHGWRVRVRDDGAGTRIASRLLATSNGAESPVSLIQSSTSSGLGIEETIAAGNIVLTTAPATAYTIAIFDVVGSGVGIAYRVEADIN